MKKKKKKVKQEPMDEDDTTFQHQEASSLGKMPILGKETYIALYYCYNSTLYCVVLLRSVDWGSGINLFKSQPQCMLIIKSPETGIRIRKKEHMSHFLQ